MSTTDTTNDVAALARRHLWLHFTRMGGKAPVSPMIVRGEGCYVYDSEGRRILDGLASLFCVNIGHGREEVAAAAAEQAAELAFFSTWSFSHPRAAELAGRIAGLTPGDLNRVFFTGGGGEAVEAAVKLARQYHKLTGNPQKVKVIAREGAYHGTGMGALALTGIAPLKNMFEPVMPGGRHVPDTNMYRLKPGHDPLECAEAIREKILFEGPETVAAVFLEPVQNSGGSIPPPDGYFQRVREICDEFNVLLVSDEVICSWGRLGHYFGCERYGYQPDIITTAKGLTSGYAPMGALIASDKVFEPFSEGYPYLHGLTFGGHPMCAAVALANIDIMEREGLVDHVLEHEDAFRDMLDSLRDIPIVGDVRGAGYFWSIELSKNRETKETFVGREVGKLRGTLSSDLLERGLYVRVDDRGAPVVVFSPPLIAGPEQFAEMETALRPALTTASKLMGAG